MPRGLWGALAIGAALAALILVHALRETQTVTAVIDGRTIHCADGRTVRLRGVAVPDDAAADAGRKYLERLLLGKPVRITPAPGQAAAYVYSGEILVNGRMIRDGYAAADTHNDYPERELFTTYEKQARASGLGIWKE